MSYFVIIRGPLGCGKSTIAKKLAELLHAEYVSTDSLLEKLGLDKADHYEGTIPVKNFIEADEMILPDIKKKLEEGRNVVFDGCFQHKAQIEHLISNLSAAHYVFTLKAPLEVCIERDSKRKRVYGKDAARAVHNLVSRFDYGIIIDVTKSLDKVIQEILSYLPKP